MKPIPGNAKDILDLVNDAYYQEGIGKRLFTFRKFLGLSLSEMAAELNIKAIDLQKMESGQIDEEIFIPALVRLIDEYGLAANWLTSGHGFVFCRKGPKTPDEIYQFQQELQDPEKADLFINMVLSPVRATSILAKVINLTNFFRDEINAYGQAKAH